MVWKSRGGPGEGGGGRRGGGGGGGGGVWSLISGTTNSTITQSTATSLTILTRSTTTSPTISPSPSTLDRLHPNYNG